MERSSVEVPAGSIDLVVQTENIIYICEAISMLLIIQLLILVDWAGLVAPTVNIVNKNNYCFWLKLIINMNKDYY